MRLNEPLAQVERLRRDIRKALVATLGRLLVAKFFVVDAPYHLALPVAYRQVLVESVDDGTLGQRVSDLPDHVVAKEQGVLEMNDSRSEGNEELVEVLGVEFFVRNGPGQPFKFIPIGVKKVLVGVTFNQAKHGPGVRSGVGGKWRPALSQEDRLEITVLANPLI